MKKPKLEKIINSILKQTSIDIRNTRTRKREVVDVKRIYFYIAKEKTHYTLKEIASYVKMDHATVIHHHKKCKDLLEFDRGFKNLFDRIYYNIPYPSEEEELRTSAANHLVKYRYFKQKLNKLKLAS